MKHYENMTKLRLISILKDTLESHKKIRKRFENLKKEHTDTITRNEDYRERIDKAIEYIENNVLTYIDEDGLESITDKEENELIKILRGDKE